MSFCELLYKHFFKGKGLNLPLYYVKRNNFALHYTFGPKILPTLPKWFKYTPPQSQINTQSHNDTDIFLWGGHHMVCRLTAPTHFTDSPPLLIPSAPPPPSLPLPPWSPSFSQACVAMLYWAFFSYFSNANGTLD